MSCQMSIVSTTWRRFAAIAITTMCVLLSAKNVDAITLAQYLAGGTPQSPTLQGWTTSEVLEAGNPSPLLATEVTSGSFANAGAGTTGWTVRDYLDGNVNLDLPQYFHSLSTDDFNLMQSNGWKFTATLRMDGLNAGRDMRVLNIDQADDPNNPFSIKVNARYHTNELTSNLRLMVQQGSGTLNLDTGVLASQFNTLEFEDVDGDGSFTIKVNGSFINGGLPIDSTPSSSTQITDANLIAIGANASANSGGGIEYSLLRLEAGSNPLNMSLVIDRDTGNISLTNNTGALQNIVGYQIKSNNGALHPANARWKSIAENYDANAAPSPGNGSVDPNDSWVELTSPTSRDNLSELEPDGNGAMLANGQAIDLGNAWIKNLVEDVTAEVLLASGEIKTASVSFIDGPGGNPFIFGDLNFNGVFNAADFTGVFRPGFGANTSTLSAAERYQAGDFNNDGIVDEIDFLIFNDAYNFANPLSAPLSLSIPEPSSALLLAIAMSLGLRRSRRTNKNGFSWRKPCCSVAAAVVALGSVGISDSEAAPIDISSAFNTDFIATSASEEGIGVGSSHAMMGSQSYASSSGAFTGLPDNGIVTDGTHTFQLGPYTGNNVILKSLPGEAQSATFGAPPVTVDIPNGSYSDLTMLFHWASFGASGQNAAFTVNYTTGAPQTFDWKVADAASASNTNGGVTPLVIGPLNRYFAGPSAFQTNTFSTFKQSFDTDDSRVIDSITLSQGAAADNSGNNGYFTVFALDGTPFSSSSELSLQVNETTGAVSLKNTSGANIEIDLYRITSPGNSLFPSTWTSLDDSNHDSAVWSELAATVGKVSEGAFGESTVFNNGMSPINLGAVYNEAVNAKDLVFEYHIVGTDATALFEGNIQYVTGGVVESADFNSDGDVDGRDFLTWQRGFGQLPGTSQRIHGDANGDGHVNPADLVIWQTQYGNPALSAIVSVPEPGTCCLILALPFLGLLRMRGASKTLMVGVVAATSLMTLQAEVKAEVRVDRDYSFGDDGEGASLNAVLGSGNVYGSTWDNAGTPSEGDLQDLTIVGNPRYANVSDRPNSPGTWGASFDGVDDYVMTPINLSLPRQVWNNATYFPATPFPHDYSNINSQGMQLWVKPNSLKQNVRQDIIMNSGEHGISITASNTWGLVSDLPTPIDSGAPVAFDQWSHLMQVSGLGDPINGTATTPSVLYVNGVAVAVQTTAYEFQLNQPLTIGAMQFEGNLNGAIPTPPENFYRGIVDDVEISLWGKNSLGTDYGTFSLTEDNSYIAAQLAGYDAADINLDGQVSGNGTGSPTTDDVSALIQNWMKVKKIGGVQLGDLGTRLQGDLNFDGIIDLRDAQLLRQGLINSGLGSLNYGLLTGGAIPEPSTVLLLTFAAIMGTFHRSYSHQGNI